jgi:hypothetical protein
MTMHFITLTSQASEPGRPALNREAKEDLTLIDAALASPEKRELAEAALHIAARVLERAHETVEEDVPLSASEKQALGRLGVDTSDTESDADFYRSGPVLDGMTRQALMTAEAVPLAEAARRMGVSDARLRQRIAAGSLMAVHRPHGRGWLIPAFQLTEAGEVPHLSRVLQAAGRPISAQSMDRFFRTPREDLEGMSPRDWLIAGHDPAIIESILGGL